MARRPSWSWPTHWDEKVSECDGVVIINPSAPDGIYHGVAAADAASTAATTAAALTAAAYTSDDNESMPDLSDCRVGD